MDTTRLLEFVKLIVEIANYDNVAFPLLRFSSGLNAAEIIYPEKDKDGNRSRVSSSMISTLEDCVRMSSMDIVYEISIIDERLTVLVRLKK